MRFVVVKVLIKVLRIINMIEILVMIVVIMFDYFIFIYKFRKDCSF